MKGRVAILKVHTKGKPLDKARRPRGRRPPVAGLLRRRPREPRQRGRDPGRAPQQEGHRDDRVRGGARAHRRRPGAQEPGHLRRREGDHRLPRGRSRRRPADPAEVRPGRTRSRSSAAAWPSATRWPCRPRTATSRRKTEFEDKIAGLLGGNVAERLVFGDTTTGASNDIEKATDLARRMVTEFGMSDRLGPLSFGKRDELVFLGREIGEQRNYSDEVAEADRRGGPGDHRPRLRAGDGGPDDAPRQARRPRREARRRGDGRRRGVREAVQRPAARSRTPTRRGRRSSARASRTPAPAPNPPAGLIPRRRAGARNAAADERTRPGSALRFRAVCRVHPVTTFDRPGSRRHDRPSDRRRPRHRGVSSTRPATERLESYKELLRIPSISALPRARRRLPGDRGRGSPPSCERIGVEHVEVVGDRRGHPVVYGDWLHADGRARPSLVYCHYDVQPVDPLELWELAAVRAGRRRRPDARPRRRPTTRASSISTSGRSRRSWRRAARLPVNLTLRLRGRGGVELGAASTAGSRPTATRLAGRRRGHQRHGLLRGQPAGDHGRRCAGMMYAQIDVDGCAGRPPLGRLRRRVQNPANALAQIIAALKGPDGRIRIPGFYDDVVALTDEEREALAALPFDEEAYRAATRRAGARRRGRVHDARAQGRPADARRQRHLGRLPGRGREDDHPGPRPRQGQLPARRGPGPGSRSSRRCGPTSTDVAPPGRHASTVTRPRRRAARA